MPLSALCSTVIHNPSWFLFGFGIGGIVTSLSDAMTELESIVLTILGIFSVLMFPLLMAFIKCLDETTARSVQMQHMLKYATSSAQQTEIRRLMDWDQRWSTQAKLICFLSGNLIAAFATRIMFHACRCLWKGFQRQQSLYQVNTPGAKNSQDLPYISEVYHLQTGTNQLPKGSFQHTECSVCLDNFERDDHVVYLQCGHLFDLACIRICLEQSNRCPYCRQQAVSLKHAKYDVIKRRS